MQTVDKRSKSKGVAGFGERMNTALAARKAQLEKCQAAKVDVTSPAYLEQQAIRQAAAAARAERDAKRKAEKEAAKAQVITDRKEALKNAEALAIAEVLAQEEAKAQAAQALIENESQRKAARDARYAARKSRK